VQRVGQELELGVPALEVAALDLACGAQDFARVGAAAVGQRQVFLEQEAELDVGAELVDEGCVGGMLCGLAAPFKARYLLVWGLVSEDRQYSLTGKDREAERGFRHTVWAMKRPSMPATGLEIRILALLPRQ
jgi:hypothetical protein